MIATMLACSLICIPTLLMSTTVMTIENLFGTDGIRRTIGTHPLTLEALPQLGSAIARWAEQKYGNNPTILLGHDTRTSCDFVKAGLKLGLLRHGITIYDAGVLSTPAVCFLTKHHSLFDCAIVISASHNAYTDNGIKVIDGNNIKLTQEDEELITHLFSTDTAHPIMYAYLGREESWHQGEQEYIDHIVSLYPPHFLRGSTIVLDCAYGATYRLAPRIFKRCGARVISLHKHPNGENINKQCGSQHPERLQEAVLEYKAIAGFAFDGDGDRVIAVNSAGEVVNGDHLLAFLLNHPRYRDQKTVVGTIMTNEGFNVFLTEHHKQLLRTPVGDKYVAQKLDDINADLGGEQSGHIILRDYLKTGDGIMTALRIMETIIATNNSSLRMFTDYPQVLINIPITTKKDLSLEPLASIIKKYEKQLQKGRIVVRYSGTELCARVMVEDVDPKITASIAECLAKELQTALTE